ncbi:hypothetical protein AeMF1_021416 [Aphanomyces euteiches]|nr:hypothetical protein AeMF1_021416 [Aphanomyces euteiches]
MRLLFSIALATSAALALNQRRQDSPAILAHQEDSAAHYDRMLHDSREGKKFNGQEATGVSYESAIRRLKPKGNSKAKDLEVVSKVKDVEVVGKSKDISLVIILARWLVVVLQDDNKNLNDKIRLARADLLAARAAAALAGVVRLNSTERPQK